MSINSRIEKEVKNNQVILYDSIYTNIRTNQNK